MPNFFQLTKLLLDKNILDLIYLTPVFSECKSLAKILVEKKSSKIIHDRQKVNALDQKKNPKINAKSKIEIHI